MTTDDRLRDAVLAAAGIREDKWLGPRDGWSNRAWVGSTFVVRVSTGRLRGSLSHDAEVSRRLASTDVPAPEVIAWGATADLPGDTSTDDAGEWIVSRRLPGVTLAVAWPTLSPQERRLAGNSLGRVLRGLHRADVGDLRPPWWVDAQQPEEFHNAYRPPVTVGPSMVEAARRLPGADQALLDDVGAMLASRLDLFRDDRHVFTHNDAHGHNVLVGDDPVAVTGLLDWEGSHPAAPDLELDMLLRWAHAAHNFPERPGAPTSISPSDVVELIDNVREGYPDLFAAPRLRERLEVYDAHWHLVQLFFHFYWRRLGRGDPSDVPSGWTDLRDLLDGRRLNLRQ